MLKLFTPLLLLVSFCDIHAQGVGIGTTSPHPSARLDVSADNKGLLIPRIELQALNMAAPLTSPAASLLLYNTATAGASPNSVTPGFYSWDADALSWVRLLSAYESLWYATETGAPAVQYLDDIYRKSKVGIGTNLGSANTALLQVGAGSNTNLGFLVTGNTDAAAAIPNLGAGSRMMYYPGKGAFRAGYVSGIQWDNVKTGYNSAAFGRSTVASGISSFAAGDSSVAVGHYSIAMGQQDSAIAMYAVAIGHQSKALGNGSRAIGLTANAYGSNSTAIGTAISAEGPSSTAIGYQASTVGSYSTAIGWQAYTQGNYSAAFGSQAKAYGNYSVAIGNNTQANGASSTAIGNETLAQGASSTAMGYSTQADDFATAMGYNTSAGIYATAMGLNSQAPGQYSTAMGRGTVATGEHSTATGWTTTARSMASFSLGAYNDPVGASNPTTWVPTDPLLYVGNGTAGVPSNALVVYKNANTDIKGFTRLGNVAEAAPRIKMKKLTGTSSPTQGTWVNVAHGLTQSKIIGVNIILSVPEFVNVPPAYTFHAGYEFQYQVSATNIVVLNMAGNSINILSKSFTVLITYEE